VKTAGIDDGLGMLIVVRLDVRMGAGPRHLVEGGLPETLRDAGHEVEVTEILLSEGFQTEVGAGMALMQRTAGKAATVLDRRRVPFLLSGTCGVALGMPTALRPARTGLLWFDALGDAADSPRGRAERRGVRELS
jgi:arginase family enzyme